MEPRRGGGLLDPANESIGMERGRKTVSKHGLKKTKAEAWGSSRRFYYREIAFARLINCDEGMARWMPKRLTMVVAIYESTQLASMS
jgi:hypothetical protein